MPTPTSRCLNEPEASATGQRIVSCSHTEPLPNQNRPTAYNCVVPWTIIVNPRSGRGRAAQFLPQLRAMRPLDEILLTEGPRHAEALARAAAARGRGVAAAGGDGTMNEVLNGALAGSANPVLAIIPLGTGNDFARTLGLRSWQHAAGALDTGTTRSIDVGVARGASGERHWLNVAGAGFDAAVAQRINRGGWLRGTPAYIAAVARTLRQFRPAGIDLSCDGVSSRHRALLCAIANARSYGGGMLIAPEAEVDDGLLDTCVIGDASPAEFLRAFPSVFRGAHTGHPKISMNRTAKVTLRCDGWAVLLDGEIWEESASGPLEFSLLPRALRVRFPAPSEASAHRR